ncbi:MAG: hypothetical protein MJZ00_06575 [Paludibacteraceae bacterium]|nr:hypothetical protein [Paludibacteraceae bacterium]
MKKTFVSALAVLNFMFAFAQEDNVVIENQSVGTEQMSPNNEQTEQKVRSSSSSDDFDSDFFASNNVSSGRDGEYKNVFGLRFGYSSSKVASLGVYTGAVSGFTFGVVDQIWFGESNVFAEVGAFFNQKGYSLKDFEPSETKLNYIEVPAMVCHRIGRESLSITAKAGGYIAMGLSGTLKTFVSEDPSAMDLFREEHKYDVFKEGSLSRFDAGVRFGLAVMIRKVMLGCRYDLGLYDISQKDIIYGDDNLMLGYKNLKNRCFQILMGFNFR